MKLKTLLPLAMVSLLLLLQACMTFYKASPARSGSASAAYSSVDSLNKLNRYFILRTGNKAYYIKNIELSPDQQTATCLLDILPDDHKLHLMHGRNNKMNYKKSEPEHLRVLSEVHFYIPQDPAAVPGAYVLRLDQVSKIEVIEHDKKRTTSSYVLGAVGYTLGAVALAGIIVVLTKSSCPFVSAYDGNEFSLQGEIYGGAIYPQLCRTDYLPLKMAPMSDGSLQLKISNELKEKQYTDFARLWKIIHPGNVRIIANEKGELFSIADPQKPEFASLNGNKDIMSALEKPGDYSNVHMDDSSRTDARNEIILKFRKPANAKKGKLILSLKNSYWLDLLYGELAKGLGSYYPTYISQQKKKPAGELLKWVKEQQIPLEIAISTEQGWRTTASLTTIGPLAFRETAIAIDLSAIKEDMITIKLSSGFMFWEIDYAAIDYSTNGSYKIEKLDPWKARDESGKNVLPQLEKEDGVYLDQPLIGNVTTLVYKSKSLPHGQERVTYILETKGYYEHIRDFKTPPDTRFLQQFTQPGAFPAYSMSLYKKIKQKPFNPLAGTN
jgi:hypothetical protein